MIDIVLGVKVVVYLLENSKQMQHCCIKRGTNVDLKQSLFYILKSIMEIWKTQFYQHLSKRSY